MISREGRNDPRGRQHPDLLAAKIWRKLDGTAMKIAQTSALLVAMEWSSMYHLTAGNAPENAAAAARVRLPESIVEDAHGHRPLLNLRTADEMTSNTETTWENAVDQEAGVGSVTRVVVGGTDERYLRLFCDTGDHQTTLAFPNPYTNRSVGSLIHCVYFRQTRT